MMVLLLCLFLLTSCCFSSTREVVVTIPDIHAWTLVSDLGITYLVEYLMPEGKKSLFLGLGQSTFSVTVPRGVNVVFVAHPFGNSYPLLGGVALPDGKQVSLVEAEGVLCSSLLDAGVVNYPLVSNLAYAPLRASLIEGFDELKFITEIVSGTFRRFSPEKTVSCRFDSLPSGNWYPAGGDLPVLLFPEGMVKSYTLDLYPGIYAFYCPRRKLEMLALVENGKCRMQFYARE